MSGSSTATTPLTALITEGVGALVDAGHTPAAVGVALRGPDEALVTVGHRVHPRRTATVPPATAGTAGTIGPGTLFALGSITKTVTTLLLAEMAACGIVTYDDPIDRHLPPEARPRGDGPIITLAQLATHSAGLPRLPRGFFRHALPRLRADPYSRYSVDDLHRATARLRPRRELPEVRYSTFGIGLLGHLLARAARMPYAELVTERVLAPLGMRDTGMPAAEALVRQAACGHRRGRPVPHWRFDALAGAGALYTSGADMLCYLRAQLDPGIAPPPLAAAINAVHQPWHKYPRGSNFMGLGWNVRTIRGRTLLWHSGGTGGFTAFMGFSPDAGAGVAVLANTTPSLRQPVILAARRLFKSVVYG